MQRSLEKGTPFIGVNVNYRLGIFGFGFSSDVLEAQSAPDELKGGNFGLGDQRVALRWISQNIAGFGGDPSKVTIAGQSAGGVSTQLHVFEAKFGSQQALFRRAIQQSGGIKTMNPHGLGPADEKWQRMYAKLGIEGNSGAERMEGLFKMSQSELLATAVSNQWFMFPPVKDGMTISDGTGDAWLVHFGKHENRPKRARSDEDEPITVLVGDCEEEVRNPQSCPSRPSSPAPPPPPRHVSLVCALLSFISSPKTDTLAPFSLSRVGILQRTNPQLHERGCA